MATARIGARIGGRLSIHSAGDSKLTATLQLVARGTMLYPSVSASALAVPPARRNHQGPM